ncbi:MAG TPA: DUF58 domain-containing protein [Galbitalea sp.]|nr:DUF58 domain-containing protein [Galbitalea sp.]
MTDTSSGDYRWIPSAGLVFGLVAGILLVGAGLLFSRPQLVLIAAPILVSVIWTYQRRPRTQPSVSVGTTVAARTTSRADVAYSVEFDVPSEAEAIVVRLYERGRERSELVVDSATAALLSGEIEIVHSGPQELVRVDYRLVGPQGGVTTAPVVGPRSSRVIPPRLLPLRRLPLPFRMFGLSGGHDSSRPGDGGEFRDIGQFVPGDRLRRIDWKVTVRRGQGPGDLYVRRSFSTADATVLVVMDSRDEVAQLVTNRNSNLLKFDSVTSLDLAREAASSLASAYIASGDRVGFRDLARSTRVLAPAGGSAQLHRLLPTIAQTRPFGAPQRRVRPPIIPAGALVYLLSTFLDGEAAKMAELWRVAGHRVVAVDTLPPTTTEGLRSEQRGALRIVQLEREARILALESLGVDIIRWHPMNRHSPESQLAALSRVARRRR